MCNLNIGYLILNKKLQKTEAVNLSAQITHSDFLFWG
mgnify:CR=1 FL=1